MRGCLFCEKLQSLSARRAWIEIIEDLEPSTTRRVALRKESVDRNVPGLWSCLLPMRSLSARRAWIEIRALSRGAGGFHVALRKESVDRNTFCARGAGSERGSLSARRAWIEICGGRLVLLYALRSLSARRAWIEIFDVFILSPYTVSRSPQGERG